MASVYSGQPSVVASGLCATFFALRTFRSDALLIAISAFHTSLNTVINFILHFFKGFCSLGGLASSHIITELFILSVVLLHINNAQHSCRLFLMLMQSEGLKRVTL